MAAGRDAGQAAGGRPASPGARPPGAGASPTTGRERRRNRGSSGIAHALLALQQPHLGLLPAQIGGVERLGLQLRPQRGRRGPAARGRRASTSAGVDAGRASTSSTDRRRAILVHRRCPAAASAAGVRAIGPRARQRIGHVRAAKAAVAARRAPARRSPRRCPSRSAAARHCRPAAPGGARPAPSASGRARDTPCSTRSSTSTPI